MNFSKIEVYSDRFKSLIIDGRYFCYNFNLAYTSKYATVRWYDKENNNKLIEDENFNNEINAFVKNYILNDIKDFSYKKGTGIRSSIKITFKKLPFYIFKSFRRNWNLFCRHPNALYSSTLYHSEETVLTSYLYKSFEFLNKYRRKIKDLREFVHDIETNVIKLKIDDIIYVEINNDSDTKSIKIGGREYVNIH